ncbi:MAG: hypothetical protein AAGH90_08350 [Pseudomonadota bacterium]
MRGYGYDVENRLISVSGGGDSATLSYDPNGRLFQTVINGATTRPCRGLLRLLLIHWIK